MVDIELVTAVVAALIGGLVPGLRQIVEGLLRNSARSRTYFESRSGKIILQILRVKASPVSGPTQLFADLSKASAEMDRIVGEIGRFSQERQAAVIKLEADLGELSEQEQELKKKIEGLEKVPLAAAEYFAQLVQKTEKKSAFRDYILFLLGVVVSAVVAIVLRAFKVA